MSDVGGETIVERSRPGLLPIGVGASSAQLINP